MIRSSFFLLLAVWCIPASAQFIPQPLPNRVITVAASNSSASAKANSKYDAAGTADELTIEAAIAAAGQNAVVYLEDGDFYLAATINADQAGLKIRGEGRIHETVLTTGTAQSGTASTIQLASGAVTSDDQFNGYYVTITGGTGINQIAYITDSAASTDTLTIDTTEADDEWSTNPDNTSTYSISNILQPMLSLDADDISIEGIKFLGSESTESDDQTKAAIKINADRCAVIGCTFSGKSVCIDIDADESRIIGNDFTGFGEPAGNDAQCISGRGERHIVVNNQARDHGSFFTAGDVLTNATIQANRITGMDDNGIYMSSASYCTVGNNAIHGTNGAAIKFRGYGNVADGNTISNQRSVPAVGSPGMGIEVTPLTLEQDTELSRNLKVFSSGSTKPFTRDVLIGGSSGNIATVLEVWTEDGSWSGGDAEGYILFSTDASDFDYGEVLHVQGANQTSGTAQGGASTTIQLASGAIGSDDQYNNMFVRLTGGTGSGQGRIITDSVAATDTLTVATWDTTPDATTTYTVVSLTAQDVCTFDIGNAAWRIGGYANVVSNNTFIDCNGYGTRFLTDSSAGNKGTTQAATSTTIQLVSGDVATDDIYNDTLVRITSGTGSGQVRLVTDSVASTDTLTVSEAWDITPDGTSTYEVAYYGYYQHDSICEGNTYVDVANERDDHSAIYFASVIRGRIAGNSISATDVDALAGIQAFGSPKLVVEENIVSDCLNTLYFQKCYGVRVTNNNAHSGGDAIRFLSGTFDGFNDDAVISGNSLAGNLELEQLNVRVENNNITGSIRLISEEIETEKYCYIRRNRITPARTQTCVTIQTEQDTQTIDLLDVSENHFISSVPAFYLTPNVNTVAANQPIRFIRLNGNVATCDSTADAITFFEQEGFSYAIQSLEMIGGNYKNARGFLDITAQPSGVCRIIGVTAENTASFDLCEIVGFASLTIAECTFGDPSAAVSNGPLNLDVTGPIYVKDNQFYRVGSYGLNSSTNITDVYWLRNQALAATDPAITNAMVGSNVLHWSDRLEDLLENPAQSGYTAFGNLATDRTLDANATTLEEVADVLGTLLEDLKSRAVVAE